MRARLRATAAECAPEGSSFQMAPRFRRFWFATLRCWRIGGRTWPGVRVLAVPDAGAPVADVVTARGTIESGEDAAHRRVGAWAHGRTATTGYYGRQLPGPGEGGKRRSRFRPRWLGVRAVPSVGGLFRVLSKEGGDSGIGGISRVGQSRGEALQFTLVAFDSQPVIAAAVANAAGGGVSTNKALSLIWYYMVSGESTSIGGRFRIEVPGESGRQETTVLLCCARQRCGDPRDWHDCGMGQCRD